MSVDHTQRLTTECRTPLDERSACFKALYLTTLTIDKGAYAPWDSNPQSQQANCLRPTP